VITLSYLWDDEGSVDDLGVFSWSARPKTFLHKNGRCAAFPSDPASGSLKIVISNDYSLTAHYFAVDVGLI
jgi:hypothetical protein